jgi:polyphosphate kinase
MLEGFLRKVGVGSYDQLTEEEKKTYREYEEILNGRRITDEEVRLFFNQQLEQTTEKLLSTKLDTREDTFLKMKLEFLRNITSFLDAPEREKKQLQNLINS